MEGRETATRGYALAAEYAASLFKMWGVKPAGDMPMMGELPHGRRRRPGAPGPPRADLLPGIRHARRPPTPRSDMTIEVAKGGAVKSRDVPRRPGLSGRLRGHGRRR
ncbi:MAG: hypothetical protein M0C28_47570 [Candidatus Moduliflexus flocculans]|nr:hypothetical protein [Candidatus Moduliflexus flocculans]